MDKPTPDGRLVITYMDGVERTIFFNDIRSHGMDHHGTPFYIIWHKDNGGRQIIPLCAIRDIQLWYNSDDYGDRRRAWGLEAHPEHEANDELDQDCDQCRVIISARIDLGMATDA